jgi:ferrous iron transport protein A
MQTILVSDGHPAALRERGCNPHRSPCMPPPTSPPMTDLAAMNMRDVPRDALSPPSSAATGHAPADRVAGTAALSLADLDNGAFATIASIATPEQAGDRELVMRMIEIGFVPGERVHVIAVGHPGREPIAVRLAAAGAGRRSVNGATFALRRHEAHFIRVVPDAPTA